MPSKHIKRLLKTLLSLSALALLVFALLPERVKVDMATVEKGELLITLDGEGKTRIHDIYVLSAPIEGRITRINSEANDIVIAGKTIIANMYPANPGFLDKRSEIQALADVEGARAALALAKARVKQAQAQLDYEEADFKRTQVLFSKNSISESRLESAELRIKTLKAELETTLSNKQLMASRLNAAKATLIQPDDSLLQAEKDTIRNKENDEDCHICIHSPVDGRVLRILHKSESIVPVGTKLVEIGDPSDLEVIIEMLSTNAVKVNVGDEALIKRWGGEEDIRARVSMIEPSAYTKISALGVEEQRVNVILDFIDPPEKWQALGNGFRVEAAIVVNQAEQAIKVPLSALFRDNKIWSTFKIVDGIARLTKVETGLRNDRYVQIIKGLVPGEQVIVHPGNMVEDGVKVEQR